MSRKSKAWRLLGSQKGKLEARRNLAKRNLAKRKRQRSGELAYESLEPRTMLNATPIARDDLLYYTAAQTALSANLLDNDYDVEGQTLTAALVGSSPTSGNLVLNTNGSFTFTPHQGFQGTAQWSYQISE